MRLRKVIMFYCLGFLIWLLLFPGMFYLYLNSDEIFAKINTHVYDKIEDVPFFGKALSTLSNSGKIYELSYITRYKKYIIWGTTDKDKFYEFCDANASVIHIEDNPTNIGMNCWEKKLPENLKAIYPDFSKNKGIESFTFKIHNNRKYSGIIFFRENDGIFWIELSWAPNM